MRFLNDEGEELEELEGEEHDDELVVGLCGTNDFSCGDLVGEQIIEFHCSLACTKGNVSVGFTGTWLHIGNVFIKPEGGPDR